MIWIVGGAFAIAGAVVGHLAYRWGWRQGARRRDWNAPGIRLRVVNRAGILIGPADSEQLYFVAKYGRVGRPGDWYEIFRGDGIEKLRVEIQPVMTGRSPGE